MTEPDYVTRLRKAVATYPKDTLNDRVLATRGDLSAILAEQDKLREALSDGVGLLEDASSGFIPLNDEDAKWNSNRDTWVRFVRAALITKEQADG